MALTEEIARQPAAPGRWLSIVGIGEEGVDGLNAEAKALIQSAAVVFGGGRHLELAATLIRGTALPWIRPFERNVPEILANRGRAVCVLASGDPFQHGIGSILSRHVASEETVAIPTASAFTLAASRLHWSLPQCVLLSLCGRSHDFIRPHLQPGARILILTSDGAAPAALAGLLSELGFGSSRITVLEALGGSAERVRASSARNFDCADINPLNTLAVEVEAAPGARILYRAAGLPDDLFEHDGQITKHEVRALTLSALAPRRYEHLWDVGAGCGSVAIEWLLADVSLRAVAIERRPERAARIARNAAAFGVPDLQVVQASAPAGFSGLPAPDAIFVGGGATTPGLLSAVREALRPQGRLVVNAVSLETEAVLLHHYSQLGGTLTRLAVSRAGAIGGAEARMSGWRPAMPVSQWVWMKKS